MQRITRPENMTRAREMRKNADALEAVARRAGIAGDEGVWLAAAELRKDAAAIWPEDLVETFHAGSRRIRVSANVDGTGNLTIDVQREEKRRDSDTWQAQQVVQIPASELRSTTKLMRSVHDALDDLELI